MEVLRHKESAVCTHAIVLRSRAGVIKRKLMFAEVNREKNNQRKNKTEEQSTLHKRCNRQEKLIFIQLSHA